METRSTSRYISPSLLSCSDAITGGSIYRKSSYLTDKLGETIASELVDIEDNALIRRGPASKPYDGEGLAIASLHRYATDRNQVVMAARRWNRVRQVRFLVVSLQPADDDARQRIEQLDQALKEQRRLRQRRGGRRGAWRAAA